MQILTVLALFLEFLQAKVEGRARTQCSFRAFSADSRTAACQSVYTSSSHLPERRSSLKVCSTKRLNHRSSKMCLIASFKVVVFLDTGHPVVLIIELN